MEKVTNGKYVELAYELSELDGTKEETMLVMTKEHPECIVFGVEQDVLPALLNALEGKTVGDTFDTVIEPKDAFGEFNEKLLMTLERELFERDGKFDSEHVHNGAIITMMTAEGYPVQGLVLNVGYRTGTSPVMRRRMQRLQRMRRRMLPLNTVSETNNKGVAVRKPQPLCCFLPINISFWNLKISQQNIKHFALKHKIY